VRRVAGGWAEKGWADRVCSGVVIGNYSGPNGERGENETPSSENDARAGDEFKPRTGTDRFLSVKEAHLSIICELHQSSRHPGG